MGKYFHKDVAGFPLEIGDIIAVTVPGYSDLAIRKVFGFTAKKVKLSSKHDPLVDSTEHRFPYQVCFVRRLGK